MKKTTIAALALTCCGALTTGGLPLMAQTSPTATTEVYNFDGFADTNLLELFYNALQQGRKYPTTAEFEAAGILPSDLAAVRSHVRRAEILDRSDRVVPNTYETRNLWCNLPMDIGSGGSAGYPDGDFSSDVFSMWNYTNLFGSWNHSFFQAPGAWVDAAHKNGTDIMSGIKFFESWTEGSGDANYTKLISEKNADGTYKYVKPLINCLMFFGSDGINYNWEDNSYSDEDVVAFHKALYKEAAEQGFDNFHIGIYTAVSTLTASSADALFGTTATGKTTDLMLNYANGDFSYGITPSVTAAENAMGTADGLYAGVWIVSMNRGWDRLDQTEQSKKAGICLWGEHSQSRFMSYNSGADAYENRENYQRLLERGFSGGNRNPASRPAVSSTGNEWEGENPLGGFCGLAEFIPERSAIQGNLPFCTYFNLGNGDRYNYKGKKTGSSWYNMANQDRVPTYRWLVYNANSETVSTDVQPEFSTRDAYTGGTCLNLSGRATSTGTDIILFKTKLTASAGNTKARIAVKNRKTGTNPSNLYVIVRTEGSNTWQEFPVGDIEGNTWQEKDLDLSAIAQGTVIDRIGLRVKGSDDAYNLYVGKLQIDDNFRATPAEVKNVMAEVKEETQGSMSLKLNWEVDATAQDRADWNLLYNDEANIDHFEILYKNGENGRVSEVGRTTQWGTFVNDIVFESTADDPYIGVRSVSTDLCTYSKTQWLHVSRADQSTLPAYDAGTYGVSEMDPAAEGADIARVQRYVTDVTTTGATVNLDYHADAPVADGTQYANCLDHTLQVEQGQQINLHIKAYDTSNLEKTDGLRWCFAGAWMDLDGSGTFAPDSIELGGELLFRLGKTRAATPEFETEGIDYTFTVPSDARTGQSRLRLVFTDAWFGGTFLPTGYTAKGFSMDFNVEITGNNPERPAPEDVHDQGVADEPLGLDGGDVSGIESVKSDAASTVGFDNGTLQFGHADKAWIYSPDGKLVDFVKNPSTISTKGYTPGTYVVRMQNGSVIRSQKVAVK